MMIEKEDYVEPRCVLCMGENKKHIPLDRVFAKLDSYFYGKNYLEAENLLKYWKGEAESVGDESGKLSVLNELVGLYRKINKKEEGLNACRECLEMTCGEEISQTVLCGTTFLNVATAYKVFNDIDKALELYAKAEDKYLNVLKENDFRFSGLYNNYALCLMDKGEYKKAEEKFFKAIDILSKNDGGEIESAITYCNLCDLELYIDQKDSKEKIEKYLSLAKENLEKESIIKNGDYAYACSKCAPAFEYFGYTKYAEELNYRSKEIYERY